MPVLASLIASLFGGIAAFLVEFVTKKIAVAGAAIAAFAVCLGVLMTLFNSLVTPLVQAMFTTQYGQFIGLAFPPMAGTCLASISATWMGCALYKLKMQSIKLTASV